jgi:hypothetical protein
MSITRTNKDFSRDSTDTSAKTKGIRTLKNNLSRKTNVEGSCNNIWNDKKELLISFFVFFSFYLHFISLEAHTKDFNIKNRTSVKMENFWIVELLQPSRSSQKQ